MAPTHKTERGAALLVVTVTIAVLTALAVQLAYDTRVSLQIAANARDELRATYLAKSGVALSRLVLSFQQKLDGGPFQQTQTAAGGAGSFRPLIWRMVPVGSTLVNGLFGEGAPGAAQGESRAAPEGKGDAAAAAPARAQAGDGFDAKIEDEGAKINVQLDGATGPSGNLGTQVQGLYQLICDSRWDPLFDREDESGQRVSRQELLVYLHDWITTGDQGSQLDAAFPAGTCAVLPQANPFPPGFQDKSYAYDRGPDRYRNKNARMDSLDELYMIAGVGDAFMAAFGDSLTAYLRPDAPRNVNVSDKRKLVDLAAYIAEPSTPVQAFVDPFGDLLQKQVMLQTMNGTFSMSAKQFSDIVASLKVPVDQGRLKGLTDRSSVYGIRAEGRAGAVAKTLDVVVRMDGSGLPTPVPGVVVHWREE